MSRVLEEARAVLAAQEAKGLNKYGADLDAFMEGLLPILKHRREEVADDLMYTTTAIQLLEERHATQDKAPGRHYQRTQPRLITVADAGKTAGKSAGKPAGAFDRIFAAIEVLGAFTPRERVVFITGAYAGFAITAAAFFFATALGYLR